MKFVLTTIMFMVVVNQPGMADVERELKEARESWVEAFNSQSNNINKHYFKLGGLFLNDQLYVDRAEISEQLTGINSTIQNIEVLRTLKTSKKRYFETGTYNVDGDNGEKMIYATVWKKTSGSDNDGRKWVKEFDVLYPQKGGGTDTTSLDASIKKWDKWVHKKSALQFTKRMYADDAVYFIKGSPVSGRSAIKNEYSSYIELPAFYLRLSPKEKIIFQQDRAIDIGSYRTPWGNGNYVRFWKQQADESWRIVFEAD